MKLYLPTGLLMLAGSSPANARKSLRGGRRDNGLVCPEGWSLLNTYDLITIEGLNTNSDVEGKTFIGGDLINSNSATFGSHLGSTTETTFSIAGNVGAGNAINIIKGSMAHSPDLPSQETQDGDWIVGGREFEIQDPDTTNHAYADGDLSATAALYKTELEDLSDFFVGLPQNPGNTLQIPGSQPGPFKFIVNEVDEYGVAVFHVKGHKIFENTNVQQIEVVTNVSPKPKLVVINVAKRDTATGVGYWNNVGNLVGSWLTGTEGRSKTIWNYNDATWVGFGDKGMAGAILAPRAKLTIKNPVDGAVAVRALKATSEIHFPLLSVECPYLPPPEETAPPTTSPTQSCSCPEGWGLLSDYNLLTTGNLNTNSDVEGKAFIGGDYKNSNSATFGAHLTESTTETTFSIAGDIVPGNAINIIKGSMSYNPSHESSVTSDGDWIVNGREFEIQDPDASNHAYADTNIVNTAATQKEQLEELSQLLSTLEQTSGNQVQIPGSQPSAFKFVADSLDEHGFAVFNIQDTQLFENNNVQQIEVVANASPEVVIINVGGTSVNWNNNVGNLVGSWLTQETGRSKTIWNFYEATSVNFGSKGMGGIVLAPHATLTIANPIDGATAVKNLKATSEVHFPLLSAQCPCL